MKVLALDTTTRVGSVALVVDDRVVDERTGDGSRTQTERLPGEITDLLASHRLAIADVDLFAVASGPGSFTGLRTGIATMQGLAFVRRRPLLGVSALDALAELGSRGLAEGAGVAVWMDAHRHEVFAALYRVEAAPGGAAARPGRLGEVEGATVGAPDATLTRWLANGARADVFIGEGAVMYAGAISKGLRAARVMPAPPLAGALGRLAAARAARGVVAGPAAIQPLYVRRPDVELARHEKIR
ncbi:MAG: tRNA (adenosine(37)-N6)-threonylcarbamoyltransferase complex dimerization subunit type 1 TsaB [Acidobacteria bacterium]|nr:tRNA (adenosine(37)-N6)-threonylcarbamoyltransferase complex dimerization subunit type 1 TsaB [Acidobacteriota bacterium]